MLVAAGVVLTAAPAAAAVKYDPVAQTGTVAGADVRKAFGWTSATLAERAGGLAFSQDFWTADNYAVACGERRLRVVHHHDFGRFELTAGVARDGYGGLSFRITGAYAGISGTSVPPAPGQPCPADQTIKIDEVRLVSSVKGWTLTATSGDARRDLLGGRSRAPHR
ncbi:hypothetical protein GCM10010172_81370 [Paractinoplanes ferrugineus]|uniref:Uncharacterized protein n=2 Tax=Paractinoplanes ferrugineus TaxID=113564 RepID=A0A919MC75_9ACTN|nr:hypothetical protein Afe05nite_22980 [Actinoplanes ferrugineus]